jgi:hypothetical protein
MQRDRAVQLKRGLLKLATMCELLRSIEYSKCVATEKIGLAALQYPEGKRGVQLLLCVAARLCGREGVVQLRGNPSTVRGKLPRDLGNICRFGREELLDERFSLESPMALNRDCHGANKDSGQCHYEASNGGLPAAPKPDSFPPRYGPRMNRLSVQPSRQVVGQQLG